MLQKFKDCLYSNISLLLIVEARDALTNISKLSWNLLENFNDFRRGTKSP